MEEQTPQTPTQTSTQAPALPPTTAPTQNSTLYSVHSTIPSSNDHTGSSREPNIGHTGTIDTPSRPPDVRQGLIPFILVIFVLILSNIYFALAYFEDDDGDGDHDPNGGNGTVEPREQIIENLTVYQSYTLIQNNTNNSRFVIIDVRAASDYNTDRIPGAINIDFFNDSYESYLSILDKNLTYLVYCYGGAISSLVQDDMEAMGYMEAYRMLNGIERWKELGYEVEGGDS